VVNKLLYFLAFSHKFYPISSPVDALKAINEVKQLTYLEVFNY